MFHLISDILLGPLLVLRFKAQRNIRNAMDIGQNDENDVSVWVCVRLCVCVCLGLSLLRAMSV